MLSNECHRCGNYIEFPEHGVGEQIDCPHCRQAIVLTNSTRTVPPPLISGQVAGSGKLESHEFKAKGRGPAWEEVLHSLEASPAGQAAASAATKKGAIRHRLVLGAILATVAVAGLLGWSLLRRAPPADQHQAAISRLQQDARTSRAPIGLFGTKWLMSMKEVMAVVPNAKKVDPHTLSEQRSFLDRPATVSYHFADDLFLLVRVRFSGPSTRAEFDQIQARLAAEYGKMPPPAPLDEYPLCSKKKIQHFVIQHCWSATNGTGPEQIFLFAGKGGNPKNLLQAGERPVGGR